MPLTKDNYINLKNGKFDSTSADELKHLFQAYSAAPNKPPLVVHFHGGLVNEPAGMQIAERLLPVYEAAGGYPVFFVWEAGLFEVLSHNLGDIFKEKIFNILLERVTQFAVGKITQTDGGRGAYLELPPTAEVRSELDQSTAGMEPYSHLDPSLIPETERLRAIEEKQFREELESDPALMKEAALIANSIRTPQEVASDTAATRGARVQGSTHTLMSPDVLAEIRASEPDTRGIVSTVKIIKGAITILAKVITRFARHRDHGLYPTIVEEILREFYVANAGGVIWSEMKKDTADAFGKEANVFGGTAFLDHLRLALEAENNRRTILIGHSTGAVYICHLLRHADAVLPPGFKFDVILLAPACGFDLLSRTIKDFGHRIANIRAFGMKDALEKTDHMLSVIYPRSLLYFVSGLLEDEVDKPLVGMERYYADGGPYSVDEITYVRRYLAMGATRSIWSESGDPLGCTSRSHHHGDFDNDEGTLQSVQYLISKGF